VRGAPCCQASHITHTDSTSHLILFHNTDFLNPPFPGKGRAVGGLAEAGLAFQEDQGSLCLGKHLLGSAFHLAPPSPLQFI
jgi:hypothetical protein